MTKTSINQMLPFLSPNARSKVKNLLYEIDGKTLKDQAEELVALIQAELPKPLPGLDSLTFEKLPQTEFTFTEDQELKKRAQKFLQQLKKFKLEIPFQLPKTKPIPLDLSPIPKIDIKPLPKLKKLSPYLRTKNPSLDDLSGNNIVVNENGIVEVKRIETGLGDLIQQEILRTYSEAEQNTSLVSVMSHETLSYLQNTSVPVEERNLKLREYLLNCLLVLNNTDHRLTEQNIIYYAKLINRAKMEDGSKDCSNKLMFGTDTGFSPSMLLGVIIHEFEHIAIVEDVSRISPVRYERLKNISTEEFVCDLAALNAYCSLHAKDPLQRDKSINDYFYEINQLDKSITIAKKYGFSHDEHHIARITLLSMFELL